MSVSDLLPSVQALPRAEKIELYKLLKEELRARDLEPLPEGFPPPEDQCPYTREELERARREPGIYTTEEVLRRLSEL